MGSILLLSGPIGAGKTTVARELVASSAGPCAYIEGDKFWFFIAKAEESQGRAERFQMIMRAMLAAARHFERDGYEVLVDFTIPPWFLAATRKLLLGKAFDYVVLRPSEAVCAARAAERNEGAIVDYTPYRTLYAAFDAAPSNIVVDDSNEARVIAASVRAGMAAGIFRIAATAPNAL